jgi:formylmethanofuran dehydrogenase subunit B
MAEPTIETPPTVALTDHHSDVVCMGCGCLCDDLSTQQRSDSSSDSADPGMLTILPACSLAHEWFAGLMAEDGPACLVRGRPVSIEEGTAAVRAILATAKRPLIAGLSNTSVEAQREAVHLAERWRGVLMGHASPVAARVHRAAQAAGLVTSTLGEVRQRADVVVLWNADPVVTHPRHFERYSLHPKGRFVPRGRKDRQLIWIGSTPCASSELADIKIIFAPGRDVEALSVLQGILNGVELDEKMVLRQTGVSLDVWRDLSTTLRQARYGAVFYDPNLSPESAIHAEHDARALMQWVTLLNESTSFVFHALTEGGNGSGLEQVVAWTTGRSGILDFGSGVPTVLTDVDSAQDLISRRSVDAALFVSSDPLREWEPAEWRRLGFIPTVVLSNSSTATSSSATVWFRTAPLSYAAGGTVFRSDGVALRVRPITSSALPSDEEILRRLVCLA